MDKTCTVCGVAKSLEGFYVAKSGSRPGYVFPRCRACTKEHKKSPRINAFLTLLSEGKKRCSQCDTVKPFTDFGPRAEWSKRRNEQIRDNVCKHCRAQNLTSKRHADPDFRERCRTSSRVSHSTHREDRLQQRRNRRKRDPLPLMLIAASKRAVSKGIEFNITINDVSIPSECPVLGIPLMVGNGKWHDGSPTIDRIDSALGYIPGNVRVISWRANRIKNDGTLEEHRAIVAYMERELRPTLKLVVG